jgi:hypothetical protein
MILSTGDGEVARERVRVRRTRRRSRPRSPLVLVLVGGIVLGAVVGALLVRDVQRVRASLAAAEASLQEVRGAVGAIEVERAAAALRRADADLADARSRTGGPLWSLAGSVPVAGDSVATTREVVRTASALVDVAEGAVVEGARLLGDGLDVQVEDGRLDLAPLTGARDLLEDLPLARLVEARDRLEAAEPRWAPGDVVRGRADTLAAADEAIGTVDQGQQLLGALPGFLGERGQRRYFLGVQTPAELRGTGGLIGYFAVLAIESGRFTLEASDVYDALEDLEDAAPTTGRIAQLAGDLTEGAPVSDEFTARYGHTAASAFFSNVNVDPDLPTTAEIMLDLFELRTGEALDGVILVDPIALEDLLVAIGDGIEVPAEFADPSLPNPLPADRFAEFATVDVYERYGSGASDERKLLLRGLGDAAFAQVFDGAWDGVAVGRAMADTAGERHLQVYSRDEAEQTAFERIGVAGSFEAPEGADLLAVTANNAVGGKQDVHLGHHVRATVTLDDPRRDDEGNVTVARRTDLEVEVDNPLPAEGMDEYIIGNCLVDEALGGCFDGPPGVNRTWFTAWAPGQVQLAALPDGRATEGVRATEFRGFAAFDRYLETQPLDRNAFELAYDGRATATLKDGVLTYDLAWWAQSKAIPTMLDITLAPPEGWRVDRVESVGGGTGSGAGPEGDGTPLTAEVGDGLARLRGTVTADAVLTVHLVPNGA